MEEWEKRENHAKAVAQAHKDAGNVVDAVGIIWVFRGGKFREALERLGHSTMTFEACVCRK